MLIFIDLLPLTLFRLMRFFARCHCCARFLFMLFSPIRRFADIAADYAPLLRHFMPIAIAC